MIVRPHDSAQGNIVNLAGQYPRPRGGPFPLQIRHLPISPAVLQSLRTAITKRSRSFSFGRQARGRWRATWVSFGYPEYMSKVPEPIRELRPHAIWSGVEFAWKLVEAAVIASLLALLQYFRSNLDLLTIGLVFTGSLAALLLGAIRRSRSLTTDPTELSEPVVGDSNPQSAIEDLRRQAELLPAGVTVRLQATHLDPRSTDPRITYKAKVRAIFTNEGTQTIHIMPLSWITGPDDVPVQFPLGYRYQAEVGVGSWKRDQWNKQELTDVQISAGGSFSVYVGLDQSIPHSDLEKRRTTKRLGTMMIPIQIGGKEYTYKERV